MLHLADYELSGGGRGLEAAVRLGPAGIVEEITAFTTEISRLRRAIDELDERQRAKQPDWSHDAVDSGKWLATRFHTAFHRRVRVAAAARRARKPVR